MKSEQLAKSKEGPPTQKYLDIAEIRDDMVILKDGTVRAVLLVSSINFALKSQEEQEAIIQSYVTFLNSINYPIQIVIQSRQMNIDNYLESLADYKKKTENDLLKAQIADYTDFVQELVELGEIMQKSFYVVVPYDPLRDEQKGFFQRFQEVFQPSAAAKLSRKQLEDRLEKIDRRVNHVMGELRSMNLDAVRLDTEGLIELYYNVYNPELFDKQPLEDINKVRVEKGLSIVEDEEEGE
jgi:hypothetical protein